MKKILLAASALSLLAAPAFAQVTNTVTVSTTVNKACGVSPGSAFVSGVKPVTLPIGTDGRLAGHDPAGFVENNLLTADQLFGDANVWCNAPATVTVYGEPLHLASSDMNDNGGLPDGFTDYIPLNLRVNSGTTFGVAGYRFPVDLNTGSGLDNATRSQSMVIPAAFAGELDGNLKFWGQENRRFIAGDYTAEWRITITTN